MIATPTSSCIQGNHFCSTVTPHGSRKTTAYYPYRKPNNLPQYISIKSNHPPNIIKQLPASINRRTSDNSCNDHEFNKAKPIYDDALKSSGYTEMLDFNKHRHPVRPRRNRQRNIIWYNPPPFSKSVKTNIGRTFLKLISRHFPRHHSKHETRSNRESCVGFISLTLDGTCSIFQSGAQQFSQTG